ncbi:MAG TPA: hypothetical protein VGE39_26775 [Prosthecobacter sp.]
MSAIGLRTPSILLLPAIVISGIVAALLGAMCLAADADPSVNGGVSVAIHDSHGLSARSAPGKLLEIILFTANTPIYLKITNTTDRELTLWRPRCPEGDDAMTIEFRDPASSVKVLRAKTAYDYHAGMGIPKVLALASKDDLIVKVDFLSEWRLPILLQAEETRELEMRVVYRSGPLTDATKKRLFESKAMLGVWTGTVTTDWHKARLINRTGKVVQPGR